MGPGGVWRQRAGRVSMIAACALALAGWVFAFRVVAFRGLESAGPAAAKQPRKPASVTIVHLRGVDIFVRNESPRSKHASGAQTSGVAAAAAAIVASGENSRIDLPSQKPHKVKAPTKPRRTPSLIPGERPAIVSPSPTTPSLAVTEPNLAKPAGRLAKGSVGKKGSVDNSSGAPVSNGGGSGSDQAGHGRPGHHDDQGNRGDRDRQPDRNRPGQGDQSGKRH